MQGNFRLHRTRTAEGQRPSKPGLKASIFPFIVLVSQPELLANVAECKRIYGVLVGVGTERALGLRSSVVAPEIDRLTDSPTILKEGGYHRGAACTRLLGSFLECWKQVSKDPLQLQQSIQQREVGAPRDQLPTQLGRHIFKRLAKGDEVALNRWRTVKGSCLVRARKQIPSVPEENHCAL